MKNITLLLILATVLVSCDQKTRHSNRVTSTDTVKKFEDPERFRTCEKFLSCVKTHNLNDAVSCLDTKAYQNPTAKKGYVNYCLGKIDDMEDLMANYKLATEDKWIIKYDTIHTLVNFDSMWGDIKKPAIFYYETIHILIDRGMEPVESHRYLTITFDLTAFNASPKVISFLGMSTYSMLNDPTTHNNEGE